MATESKEAPPSHGYEPSAEPVDTGQFVAPFFIERFAYRRYCPTLPARHTQRTAASDCSSLSMTSPSQTDKPSSATTGAHQS